MVSAVKKWQTSDPEKARENWQKLSDANLELETKLNSLSKLAKDHWDVYLGVIKSCSVLTSEKVYFPFTLISLGILQQGAAWLICLLYLMFSGCYMLLNQSRKRLLENS